MLKQVVAAVASVVGIAALLLLVGVLVRLSWDTRSAFPARPSGGTAAPPNDEALREA